MYNFVVDNKIDFLMLQRLTNTEDFLSPTILVIPVDKSH